MKNISQAFRKITSVEQIRIAKDTNEAFTPQPIVPTSFTQNTLVGILAKGDQNCWADAAAPRANTDIFDTPTAAPATEEKKAPEQTTPLSGFQTFDNAGTNIEIKQKEEAKKEVEKKEEPITEEDRLIQQYRDKQAQEKQNKDSLGTKISRWIQALTNPEE
jgi:hypothetical protein